MEYEMIQHRQIRNLKLLVDEITYRSPHMHREFEIILVLSGNLMIQGRDCQLTLAPGQFAMMNPWQTHEFFTRDGVTTALFLQVLPSVFQSYFPGAARLRFQSAAISQELKTQSNAQLREALLQLGTAYFSMQPLYEFVCMQHLNRVFELLLKGLKWEILSSAEIQRESYNSSRLERIISYVQENYMRKLLLSEVAKTENISQSFLSHFIRNNLNMSFQELVAITRFDHAKRLFEETNLSIAEVCNECGFSDARYLKKMFEKQLNTTLQTYRERGGADLPASTVKTATSERILSDQEALAQLKHFTKDKHRTTEF